MRRCILRLVAVTLLMGGSPFALAITQDQIYAEVQIVYPDAYGNIFSGSGTIIDSSGIILTNKHVVTDGRGDIIDTCLIGFVGFIDTPPDFGTRANPSLAEVKYYTTTADMDAAALYLENPSEEKATPVPVTVQKMHGKINEG